MIPTIWDNPEEKSIDIEFDLENGLFFKIFMSDESAQQFVDIVQNKINARL